MSYERNTAEVALVDVALRCLVAERAEPSAHSDAQQEFAYEVLAHAALNLVNAVDQLPKSEQPVGWRL